MAGGKRERQKLSESRCLKAMLFTVSRAKDVSLQLELNEYPQVNRNEALEMNPFLCLCVCVCVCLCMQGPGDLT